jgi:hypothetical protein
VVQNHGDENNIQGLVRKQQGLGCASDQRGAGVNQAEAATASIFLDKAKGSGVQVEP